MNSFITWLFAGIGVALGAAVPTLFSNVLSGLRRIGASLVDRLQPAERYNDLHIPSWAVEVVLKVDGGRGYSLVQSIRETGLVAEPLTSDQQDALHAATRDYGPGGPGYRRRIPTRVD